MSKYDGMQWLDGLQAILDDIDARLSALEAQAKPAPVASEPNDGLYTRHHKMIGSGVWACEEETWLPATPAQVRAEYERLFPAECKRGAGGGENSDCITAQVQRTRMLGYDRRNVQFTGVSSRPEQRLRF